jgi:soluble lytic murein transglycosylase
MKFFAVMMAVAFSVAASAQVKKIDFNQDFSSKEVAVLKKSKLAQLKAAELAKKWPTCLQMAPKLFQSQKEVQGWIALTWLHCSSEQQDIKADTAALDRALTAIEKNHSLFFGSPWSSDLAKLWTSLQLTKLDADVKAKNQKAAAGLDTLLAMDLDLSKDQKSLAYQLLGDLALGRSDYSEAEFFYEEAQVIKDSKYLQDKIEFLLKAQEKSVSTKNGNADALPSPTPGDEYILEERIKTSLKQNDLIAALKDTMTVLNQYPGSRLAKKLKDKPLEIYSQVKTDAAAAKSLTEMSSADSSRLLDWAQSLHRRGDYEGALELAKSALQKTPNATSTTQMLWLAGRCSHFLGQYDKALDYYSQLIEKAQGTDEAAEAAFRSALIYYRQKSYSSAASRLEKLLLLGKDRYDLNAQYWMIRSLQKVNKERADKLTADLIAKFPFSYYGLRLRAEQNGNMLTWPEQGSEKLEMDDEVFLVGDQKTAWRRFLILSGAGWQREAQIEYQAVPFIKDPTVKITLAKKLFEREQYYAAIRLVNDALENDPDLRREEFVKLAYPQAHKDIYAIEAKKYGIDPVLLMSLTRQESAFNGYAMSTSNAAGLMQMIPATAQEVAKKLGMKIEFPEDMYVPSVNIPMGSYYFAQVLDQYKGHVPLALASYNAGPHKVKAWLDARPDLQDSLKTFSSAPEDEIWIDELPWNETSFYVKAILRNVLMYRLLDGQKNALEPVLWQDLLNKKAK